MLSYPHRRRASELSRLSSPLKSPTDGLGSDSESRKTGVPASEVNAALSTEPTLDDFGGRSDALGG
jgi:hypothetical protein